MHAKVLPSRPSLEFYKKQAKQFLKECVSRNADALRRIREFHPRLAKATDAELPGPDFALADAQWIIAREHGFESWPKFVHHIESLFARDPGVIQFESAADAVVAGNVATLEQLLRQNPALVRARSEREHRATLLHYVSANGVEDYRQKTPKNAVEIARVLLRAGVDVDALAKAYGGNCTTLDLLVSSGHPHTAGVQGDLVEVLCREGGANVDGLGGDGGSMSIALSFLFPEAALALTRCGARIDNVVYSAAVGRLDCLSNYFDARGQVRDTGWYTGVFKGLADSSEILVTALVYAALGGHLDTMRFLIERGVDVNATSKRNVHGSMITALHAAAHSGQRVAIDFLLERGADATLHDSRWDSAPAGWARAAHHEEVAKYLEGRASTSVAVPDNVGILPSQSKSVESDSERMLEAAKAGDLETVKSLLREDPLLVHAKGHWNWTPLHHAANEGHLEIVKTLVTAGADVMAREDGDNAGPIWWAAEKGYLEIVKLLFEHGADIHATDDAHERGPLGWATVFEHTQRDVADFLISKGAQPDIFTVVALGDLARVRHMSEKNPGVLEQTMSSHDDLRRPVHLAIIKDNLEMVVLLHELGANLSACTSIGRSPLSVAAEYKRKNIIAWLKQHGAEVNVLSAIAEEDIATVRKLVAENPASIRPGGTYETAIHDAASIGNNELVEFLLDHGAGINEQDNDRKCTPLHLAAFNGHVAMLKLLVERGADMDAKDRTHQSPARGWAVYNKQDAAAAYLESVQPKSSKTPAQEVIEAARVGHAWRLQELLNKDAKLANARDGEGEYAWTPLCHAAYGGHVESVRALLAAGADPTLNNPIHFAGQRGHQEICRMLVSAGGINQIFNRNAEPDSVAVFRAVYSFDTAALQELLRRKPLLAKARDKEGGTLLQVAAVNGDEPSIRVLVQMGADPNARDNNGRKPVDSAVGHHHFQIARFLIKSGADVDLFAACGIHDLGLVKQVLAKDKPDVNAEINGMPLIENVCEQCFNDDDTQAIGRLLVEAGARVDLCTASSLGLDDRARELLKADPSLVNSRRRHGNYQPLHCAVECGHTSMVDLLLEHGADVNGRNAWNFTPLHFALLNQQNNGKASNDCHMIRQLLKYGADLTAVDNVGRSIMGMAKGQGWGARPAESSLAREILSLINEAAAQKVPSRESRQGEGTKLQTPAFIQACLEGRLADARRLLGHADVNGVNEVGQGALLTFYPDVTRFLLENGADPNRQRNENGASVLAGLSYVGKSECVKLLLSKGADPNLGREESGESPLHHAICGQVTNAEKADIVAALLDAGADPNRRAKAGIASFNFMFNVVKVRGESPLHRAAAFAGVELIQALLNAGGDKSLLDANGDSPLTWANLHNRDSEILKLLCFGEFRITKTRGQTPLDAAQSANKQKVVDLLLAQEKTASGQKKNRKANQPIFYHAFHGDARAVESILKDNPSVIHALTATNLTPLHVASKQGHAEIVRLLISGGADVQGHDSPGVWSPLVWAAYRGHIDVVRVLLEHGADPTSRGGNPVHYAGQRMHREICRLLVERGAIDNNLIDPGDADVLALFRAAYSYDAASVERILTRRPELAKSVDKSGKTPMHEACTNGDLDTVKALLRFGASAKAKDASGQTPLDRARNHGKKKILLILSGETKKRDMSPKYEAKAAKEKPAR